MPSQSFKLHQLSNGITQQRLIFSNCLPFLSKWNQFLLFSDFCGCVCTYVWNVSCLCTIICISIENDFRVWEAINCWNMWRHAFLLEYCYHKAKSLITSSKNYLPYLASAQSKYFCSGCLKNVYESNAKEPWQLSAKCQITFLRLFKRLSSRNHDG